MPNKVENAIIWTAFAISLFWLISGYFDLLLFTRNGFLRGVVIGSCILLICFYAMYWSFDIRHGLSSKIYRNQALGMALIALVLALFDFLVLMAGLDLNPVLNVTLGQGIIGTSLGSLVVVVLAYWIDVSIRATQRSDPLLRDPLQWKYVRWILWGMVFVFEIINELFYIFLPRSAISPSAVFSGGGGVTILIAIFSGIVYIPLSLRVSPDKIIRSHFLWFVLFLISVFVGFFAINRLAVHFGTALAVLFGSYCVYRSARALGRLEQRVVVKTA
jgi:hypothetical protein